MATTNGDNGAKHNKNDAPIPAASQQPTVCVFCGAREGTSPAHLAAARALAQALHRNKIHLVYGGGTVGIMGEVAKTLVSLSGPSAVHGIIPKALLKFERNYQENGAAAGDPQKTIDEKTYGRTTVVKDMHTRKQMMAQEVIAGGAGGGFVALSGGYGTLEELMEVVTWNQLGIHGFPVVVFNVDGYWTDLLKWVNNAVKAGFIAENNEGIMVEARTGDQVVERLKDYRNAEGRFMLQWGEK
ncbi:hypothetical protein LTR78_009058 [Recurvomyces mirabilis]|uniref:Lysine decarboxylase-like protein-like protein n=1 Tax=Recurvomyces mirabilis TaxID=574656 RepID=A0AAE0TSE8_9PEZI|nr:hypothetical protein LTR78_009058 [Recurvomyces mirabilis]KAK5150413.1 hypothetical protein LTS14_010103 [Recurvomyces mirabilis]